MPIGDIAPALVMAIGAALILLTTMFTPRRLQWTGAPLALAVLCVAAGLTFRLQMVTVAKLSFSGTWALDDLTALSSYAILGTTAMVVLLSPAWLQTDRRHGEWYVMLILSALGAVLMAGAADLMELMVAVLLSSVTGYTLASYHRASRMCAEAGAKYYFVGAMANPMMLLNWERFPVIPGFRMWPRQAPHRRAPFSLLCRKSGPW
jgi:NADH-quinone oxidoreductase subunit N